MTRLRVEVSAADHRLGADDAPVTLVEYGDYQCPFCRAAHETLARVRARFGRDLRFVFRNFPLTTVHPHALRAAEVAEFAGTHGRFWEMHDLLFAEQARLGDPLFEDLAGQLGLPVQDMARSLDAGTFEARVRDDFRGGVLSGVNGTPTFFINGVRHDRAPTEPELSDAIAHVLAQAD